jgi:pseudouridine synthase
MIQSISFPVILRIIDRYFYTAGVRSFSTLRKDDTERIGKKFHRLERLVANRGGGSRSEVAKLIKYGKVSVQGEIIRSCRARFHQSTEIIVDNEVLQEVPLLAIYFKPKGVLSTMKDNYGRDSLQHLSKDYPFLKTMHPVGRLDADTTGLLLFSSSGQLTHKLLNPESNISREYKAVIENTIDDILQYAHVLKHGVKTADGIYSADLLEATNSSNNNTASVRLSVTEGKYRMIRRILSNSGHNVLELHRYSYGSINLNSNLKEGAVRACSTGEQEWALRVLRKGKS